MYTLRAMAYSIIASILIFLCNNLLTASFLTSSQKHSSIAIDLIAWGIPAFVASLITAKMFPTKIMLQKTTIILTTFALIYLTTETTNHVTTAQKGLLVQLFYLLPYAVTVLSIMLGFFLGFRRQSPN